MNAAAIGLVICAVYLLYTKAINRPIDAVVALISFSFIMIHDIAAPIVVIIGGLIGFFSHFILK